MNNPDPNPPDWPEAPPKQRTPMWLQILYGFLTFWASIITGPLLFIILPVLGVYVHRRTGWRGYIIGMLLGGGLALLLAGFCFAMFASGKVRIAG